MAAPFVEAMRGTVVPAVPVPFAATGQIDHDLHMQYIEWMRGQDIGGVAVWAHTGRGLWLTSDERAAVLADWREACPDLPIVCGVGVEKETQLAGGPSVTTRAAIQATLSMARQAKLGAAKGLLVYPPTSLAQLPNAAERILEYHSAVSDVGLPVIAFYLYETAGGVSYDASLVDAILALENVVGMKVATLDSVMTFQDLAVNVSQRGSLLITGEDRFLGYSLCLGADAALVGIAAAATDRCVSLIDAWCRRDYARFVTESAAMDAFARATFRPPMEGYVQRMLWAAEADGVLSREALDRHAPPLDCDEREAVRTALRRLRGQ